MELRDKVVVVTGGASGIGAALCRRFAAEGARGVVVADRSADAANAVARECGGLAVTVDVAVEWDVRRLVKAARERFGPIDLFCSNAGVALGPGAGGLTGGPFAGDEVWRESWDVNVMAHVYAARAVLPAMLERKQGWILSTASAAGLLTDMGTLAYSVTKHAAVAFAEWLAINYGDDGIGVSCLCPQGVRTPMLMGAGGSGVAEHLLPGMIEPEAVADAVIEGLAAGQFLILPHPEVKDYLLRKASDPDRWLRGMRRVRKQLDGGASD